MSRDVTDGMSHFYAAFSALVTGAVAWSLWGGALFPREPDPTGNPEDWTQEELRRWLAAVRMTLQPNACLKGGEGKNDMQMSPAEHPRV